MASHYRGIEGWFDFDDIYELALRRTAGTLARFCEVGAYKGRSTCYLAERIAETGANVQLHVVDTFAGDVHVGHSELWQEFANNMRRAGVLESLQVHPRQSARAAREFEDESLDFIFIDAEHTFDAVSHDLDAWWPKLRRGGLIAGHDYTNFEGVARAVDRFVSEHGLASAFRTSRSSWLLYKSIRVDLAYCINLPTRHDRRRAAAAQFAKAGLAGEVQFLDAVDGRALDHPGVVSHGQAGCAASHLSALRAAAEHGASHVLLFEDDVDLVEGFKVRFEAAVARCPSQFDLFYVGALCRADWGNYLYPFDDIVARAGRILGTHAYVANLRCLVELERDLASGSRVLDEYYALAIQARSRSYACTPYLAHQSPGYSDIAGAHTDPTRYVQYVYR